MTKPVLLAGVLLTASSGCALAYIDPVTGSVIVQTIIGGAAAAMVAIRSVRERIIAFFTRKPLKQDTDETTVPGNDANGNT